MTAGKKHGQAETLLRHEIAAVTRLLNHEGILGYSGHISARLADGETFLIQPVDRNRADLLPSHLLRCDLNGLRTEKSNRAQPPSEIFIHSEIYKARPDIRAIAHFHHDPTTTFSVVEGVRLQPLKNHAARWGNGIPVHPDPGHVNTPALGRALAGTLGPHHALLIRAHGQVVVSEDMPSLLMDCVHFVENAESLYRAALLAKVAPLTAEEIAMFVGNFRRDKHASKLWNHYIGQGRNRGVLPPLWQRHLRRERPA